MRPQTRTLAAFFIVIGLSASFFFFRLGDRGFRNPDEGRYAQIAREMLEKNDWVEPTLYGLDYLKKPPLFYWLVAASFKAFGFHEWAARLVPVLAGWLGVLVVCAFAGRLFGARTALFSALMLSTNFWYLQVSRYLVIDPVFSLLVVVSLLAFYLAFHGERGKNAYRALFYLSLALAFLAKGPVALALVALTVGAYGVLTRAFKAVVSEVFSGALWGVPLFAAVVVPWFAAVIRREPEFFGSFLWHEHVKRFLSGSFEHQEPWFYYPVVLAAMLLPWTLFVRPLGCVWEGIREGKRSGPGAYLTISSLVIIVFYSLSRSKMPTYILPCLPMLMIPLAHGWRRWIDAKPVLGRAEWIAASVMAVIAIGGIIGVPLYLDARPNRYPAEVRGDFQALGAAILAGTVIVAGAIRRNQAQRLFYSLIAVMGLVAVFFAYPMETMNKLYSTKAFAQALKLRLEEGDDVFIYDHPGPFYDFAFYLEHPVKVVGLEGEFEGSEGEREALHYSVSHEEFDRYLKERKSLYCLIRKSDYLGFAPGVREQLHILKQDNRKVLFVSGSAVS